jgi:hypothetical protein
MEDRMRKIVAIENVTLDGFADSREGLGFEWTARAYDDEVDEVVFSTTLESADWANSRLISGNVAEQVARLKAQPLGQGLLCEQLGQRGH